MTWTIELWVEGPTDAVPTTDGEGEDQAGALPALVHRTLEERSGLPEKAYRRAVTAPVRVKLLKDRLRRVVALPGAPAVGAAGWVRKVLMALSQARVEDSAAIVLVVRDCDGVRERLRERDQANDTLHENGQVGLAVAECGETVEAWLLADPAAFRECFGRGPERGLPGNPESVRDPKSILRQVIAELRDPADENPWSVVYAQIASEVQLDVLGEKCPGGYGTFRSDAERLIVPAIRG